MGAIMAIINAVLGKRSENSSAGSQYGITNNQLIGNSSVNSLMKRISSPRRDNDTIFAK